MVVHQSTPVAACGIYQSCQPLLCDNFMCNLRKLLPPVMVLLREVKDNIIGGVSLVDPQLEDVGVLVSSFPVNQTI
jgi:hypothetical protein